MSNLFSQELDLQANWNRFVVELTKTGRDGVTQLIDYLESKTDFKTAPASSKYHRNTKGGLVDHSLRVMDYLDQLNIEFGEKYKKENVVVCGLLHDLCKANYYKVTQVLDKEYKDKYDKWRKIPGYTVEEELPLGHGEKSIIIANRFIPLTPSEMLAIRWHMSAWDPGIHFNYPSGGAYSQSADKCPLLKLLILADLKAELYETMNPVEQHIE